MQSIRSIVTPFFGYYGGLKIVKLLALFSLGYHFK